MENAKIAVVIPCFRVRQHIGDVLNRIPQEVWRIYCIDDCCPEDSGSFIAQTNSDPRIRVLRHDRNQGVGGAVLTGYKAAIDEGADIVVKIDGDGQMDPRLTPCFVRPILEGACDYTKGNRFYRPDDVRAMPGMRFFGNAVLSFLTKLSTGYWNIFDPTNGYTAIHTAILKELPLDKISHGYFFESDMLFRLNTIQAVVRDVPMRAVYDTEESSLSIKKIVVPFLKGHLRNLGKRIVYNYFLRNFSIASLELLLGIPLFAFGLVFGLCQWLGSADAGIPATAGTVMLSALPVLVGTQFLLSFLQFDIEATPRTPIHPSLTGQTEKIS